MNSAYIYAGTYAYVLQQKLLTETQRELLLGAHSLEECMVALQGTFLGTYISAQSNHDLAGALDTALIDAKKQLVALTPDPQLFSFVWLQYDFYNLKIIMKCSLSSATSDDSSFIPLGNYTYEELLKGLQTNTLSFKNPYLGKAVLEATKSKSTHGIDTVMDRAYLEAALEESKKIKDAFVREYVVTMVDLFNLRSRLRALSESEEGELHAHDVFVEGGTFTKAELASPEVVLQRLSRFGGDIVWKEAIVTYQDSKDFTSLDKASDDYMMRWLKKKSINLHSPAPLFAYLTNSKENIQFVRAVTTAKYVGLSEKLLRDLVRKSFSSYVY